MSRQSKGPRQMPWGTCPATRLMSSLRADRAGVSESYVAGLIHDVLVAKYKYLNRRRSVVKV
jgi:hypothetical protein